MHGLRHWYASSLLAGGASPVEVSAYLGHSDIAFTMRTYGHLMPSSAERAREAIAAAMANVRKAAKDVGNGETADDAPRHRRSHGITEHEAITLLAFDLQRGLR